MHGNAAIGGKYPEICYTHAISLVAPFRRRGVRRIRHILCLRLVAVKCRMASYCWYYVLEVAVRLVLLALLMYVAIRYYC